MRFSSIPMHSKLFSIFVPSFLCTLQAYLSASVRTFLHSQMYKQHSKNNSIISNYRPSTWNHVCHLCRHEEEMRLMRQKYLELKTLLDTQVAEKHSQDELARQNREAEIANMNQQWQLEEQTMKQSAAQQKEHQKALSYELKELNRLNYTPSVLSFKTYEHFCLVFQNLQ